VTCCPLFDGLGLDRNAVVVSCSRTFCTRILEVLFPCSGSPLYAADRLCGPAANELNENVATPLAAGCNGTVASTLKPSRNLTDPVGAMSSSVATVAVKVIF